MATTNSINTKSTGRRSCLGPAPAVHAQSRTAIPGPPSWTLGADAIFTSYARAAPTSGGAAPPCCAPASSPKAHFSPKRRDSAAVSEASSGALGTECDYPVDTALTAVPNPRGSVGPDETRACYRHSPYTYNIQKPKGSDLVQLLPRRMQHRDVYDGPRTTPQPRDFLKHAVRFPYTECEELAKAMLSADEAFFAKRRQPRAGFVVGQTGYTATPLIHRFVLGTLAPEVRVTPLTVHEGRRGPQGPPRLQDGRRRHTGLVHGATTPEALDTLVQRVHQRAYYDRDAVWIAFNAVAMRELAVFERVMAYYRNGIRTGRPTAPMTLEPSRSNTIDAQVGVAGSS